MVFIKLETVLLVSRDLIKLIVSIESLDTTLFHICNPLNILIPTGIPAITILSGG